MHTYEIVLTISAECERDAEELINDYTGRETHVEIQSIEPYDSLKGTRYRIPLP